MVAKRGVGGGIGAIGGEVGVLVDARARPNGDEPGDDERRIVPGVFEEQAIGGADVLVQADVKLVGSLLLVGVKGEVAVGG